MKIEKKYSEEDDEYYYEIDGEYSDDSDSFDFYTSCSNCGDTYVFKNCGTNEDEVFNRREYGKTIQEVLPTVDPEYRELLVTGWCPKCWEKKVGSAPNESHRPRGRMLKEDEYNVRYAFKEDPEYDYEVIELNNDKDKCAFIDCDICNKHFAFPGADPDWKNRAWRRASGKTIQELAPELSPEYREMFVSGICPDCWNDMFGED